MSSATHAKFLKQVKLDFLKYLGAEKESGNKGSGSEKNPVIKKLTPDEIKETR